MTIHGVPKNERAIIFDVQVSLLGVNKNGVETRRHAAMNNLEPLRINVPFGAIVTDPQ